MADPDGGEHAKLTRRSEIRQTHMRGCSRRQDELRQLLAAQPCSRLKMGNLENFAAAVAASMCDLMSGSSCRKISNQQHLHYYSSIAWASLEEGGRARGSRNEETEPSRNKYIGKKGSQNRKHGCMSVCKLITCSRQTYIFSWPTYNFMCDKRVMCT